MQYFSFCDALNSILISFFYKYNVFYFSVLFYDFSICSLLLMDAIFKLCILLFVYILKFILSNLRILSIYCCIFYHCDFFCFLIKRVMKLIFKLYLESSLLFQLYPINFIILYICYAFILNDLIL